MAAHPVLSCIPLVLLGYGHAACIDKTVALLLSLWLSIGGGAFKTLEDTHTGVEAGIPSIDNVLSHFAAVIKRHVSDVLPLVATVHACSRLASLLGWCRVWVQVGRTSVANLSILQF